MNSNFKEVVNKLQIPSQIIFQAIVISVTTQSISVYKIEMQFVHSVKNLPDVLVEIGLFYFSFLCET